MINEVQSSDHIKNRKQTVGQSLLFLQVMNNNNTTNSKGDSLQKTELLDKS